MMANRMSYNGSADQIREAFKVGSKMSYFFRVSISLIED